MSDTQTGTPPRLPELAYRYRIQPNPGWDFITDGAHLTGHAPDALRADRALGWKLISARGLAADALAAVADDELTEPFLSCWPRADGALCWTEHRNWPVRDEAGRLLAIEGIARDVTARKNTEDENRLLQALSRGIGEAEDMDGALSLVLEEVCRFTGWECGEAWLPGGGGALERVKSWGGGHGAAQSFLEGSSGLVFRPGQGFPGRVWDCRQPQWQTDITFQAKSAGLSAAVGIPVLAREEPVAVLTFYMVGARKEDAGLQRLVSSVAAQLGAIVRRKRAEDALRASEERFRGLAESAGEAILVVDAAGEISYFNPAAERAFGIPAAEARGSQLTRLLAAVSRRVVERELARTVGEGRPPAPMMELTGRRHDGSEFPLELSLAPWQAPGQPFATVLIRDISERRRAEERIRHLAYHDPLSGLPNRLLFHDRLRTALHRARRHRTRLAVLFLDLDRFKVINDSLGHSTGDRLLQELAGRLRRALREDDTVARVGGDEFLVLLEALSQADDVGRVAEKVRQAVTPPFTLGGHELFVTASLGIALYPEDGADGEALIKNADAAMYQVKEAGGNGTRLFTPALNERALERLALENGLHQALARRELVVHYQPVLDLRSGSIHAVEALVRWSHPERGLIPPASFIPLAESTGLVVPLGRFVLETACAAARRWQEAGHPDLTVAVNLSPRQLQQPELADDVARVLRETGLLPSMLELEVTETYAAQDPARAREVLGRLKALGVRISIDDFGVGYSSLGSLRQLPIDTLKIDQSFVRGGQGGGQGDTAIVAAVIALAHALRLEVVAEGVETGRQLGFLGSRRCDRVQGFLISRPVAESDLPGLLVEGRMSAISARLRATRRGSAVARRAQR